MLNSIINANVNAHLKKYCVILQEQHFFESCCHFGFCDSLSVLASCTLELVLRKKLGGGWSPWFTHQLQRCCVGLESRHKVPRQTKHFPLVCMECALGIWLVGNMAGRAVRKLCSFQLFFCSLAKSNQGVFKSCSNNSAAITVLFHYDLSFSPTFS